MVDVAMWPAPWLLRGRYRLYAPSHRRNAMTRCVLMESFRCPVT
jgi:hypothetical protein